LYGKVDGRGAEVVTGRLLAKSFRGALRGTEPRQEAVRHHPERRCGFLKGEQVAVGLTEHRGDSARIKATQYDDLVVGQFPTDC
jgi:hypothetical protein